MKWLNRLSRGVRIFRINAPMSEVVAELRGIREALEVICLHGFGVDLHPERSVEIPPGKDESYTTDSGPSDLDKVRDTLIGLGWTPPTDDELADPLGANANLASETHDTRPLLSFLQPGEDERSADGPGRDSIPTARRASAFDRKAALQDAAHDPDPEDS